MKSNASCISKMAPKDEIMFVKRMSEAATNIGGRSGRGSTMSRQHLAWNTINWGGWHWENPPLAGKGWIKRH